MGCCFSVKNEIEEPILETCQQYPPGTQEKQQYPPGTQINFVSFDNQNSLTINGKDFFCPEGRRGRAIRNPKDFLEPGFPAKEKYNSDWKDYDQTVTTANQLRKKYNNAKLGRIPAKNPET
jgi:hypothetical protein